MGRISINVNEKLELELRKYHLTKGGKLRDFSKSVEELLIKSLSKSSEITISNILTIDKEIEDKTKNKLTLDNENSLKSSLIDFLKLWLVRYKIAGFDFPDSFKHENENI